MWESVMRKHECSGLSLTAPQGLQTCRTIDYPIRHPMQLFPCPVNSPHWNCICSRRIFRALASSCLITVFHTKGTLCPKEELMDSFSRAWECQLDFSNSVEQLH